MQFGILHVQTSFLKIVMIYLKREDIISIIGGHIFKKRRYYFNYWRSWSRISAEQ